MQSVFPGEKALVLVKEIDYSEYRKAFFFTDGYETSLDLKG